MIRTAFLISLTFSTFFLAFAGPAIAESKTTVNVNNSTGGNTVCVNGKCTTSEGTGTSKVCVNGQCWDSTDGNVDYQSQDGNTKVNITNSEKSVTVQQNSNERSNTTVNTTTDATDIEPTIKQEVKGAQDKIEAKKEEAKKKIEEVTKGFDIMEFIKAELAGIKSFFTLEFLFGGK